MRTRGSGWIIGAVFVGCVAPDPAPPAYYPRSQPQPYAPGDPPASSYAQPPAYPPPQPYGQPPAPTAPAATSAAAGALVGVWVQDQIGSVLTYSRRFQFNGDGTFVFQHTQRNTGSLQQTVLSQQVGTYRVQGTTLVLSPQGAPEQLYSFRVARDPYVGDVRLQFIQPDATVDVFYRQ